MKGKLIPLILILTLILGGCAGNLVPDPRTVDGGTAWDESWTNLGGLVGVEQPGGGFELLTTNGRLGDMTIRYATWVCGQETELEDDRSVYEGQIYLMTEDCGTAEAAASTLDQWHGQFGAGLTVTRREQLTLKDAQFELIHYDSAASDSHFSRGVTAIWQWGDVVLVADIAAADSLTLDLSATMEQFLEGIHYAD